VRRQCLFQMKHGPWAGRTRLGPWPMYACILPIPFWHLPGCSGIMNDDLSDWAYLFQFRISSFCSDSSSFTAFSCVLLHAPCDRPADIFQHFTKCLSNHQRVCGNTLRGIVRPPAVLKKGPGLNGDCWGRGKPSFGCTEP
jgi:hypothetical protein